MDGAVGEGGEVDRAVVDDRPLGRLSGAGVDVGGDLEVVDDRRLLVHDRRSACERTRCCGECEQETDSRAPAEHPPSARDR